MANDFGQIARVGQQQQQMLDARFGDVPNLQGVMCKVVNLSPLTVDLPRNPGALGQGIPGVIYTALGPSDNHNNALAISMGAGSKPIIFPLG